MPQRKFYRAFFLACTAIVILVVISACQSTGSSDGDADSGVNSYVPADTIFFLGGLEALSLKDSLRMFDQSLGLYDQAFIDAMKKTENDSDIPGSKMFSQLLINYFDALNTPDQIAQKTGIDDNLRFAVYSVGTMPVLRIRLKDKAAFDAYISGIEKQAKVQAVTQTLGNVSIRKYAMQKPSNTKAVKTSLAIGTQGNYAIFSAMFDDSSEDLQQLNQQIVGARKPTTVLNPNTLNALIDKYHFDSRYLFFIDHKQIMRGLTHSDNLFGSMLNTFAEMAEQNKILAAETESTEPQEATKETAPAEEKAPSSESNEKAQDEKPFAKLQTPACQKELSAKVETWPRTVGGYTLMDVNSKPAKFDSKIIVEINDPKFTQSLSSLRGFIPEFVANRDQAMMLGLGIGLNIDAVAPFVTQFIQDFTAQDYQCEFLAQMKQKFQASNPAMTIAMVSGMASGVQGISANLLNIEGDFDTSMNKMPVFKDLQAIVTVSAKNPQMLLMMLSKINPKIPPLQLPADGKPMNLPLPLPVPDQIKLAQKGKHIVAYLGKDAVKMAESLDKLPLQGNGLIDLNVDYVKLVKFALSLPNANPDSPQADPKFIEALNAFQKIKYHLVQSIDITNNGIEIESKITSPVMAN